MASGFWFRSTRAQGGLQSQEPNLHSASLRGAEITSTRAEAYTRKPQPAFSERQTPTNKHTQAQDLSEFHPLAPISAAFWAQRGVGAAAAPTRLLAIGDLRTRLEKCSSYDNLEVLETGLGGFSKHHES